VKSGCKETENCCVKVGVHQGSLLSPSLFSLVMDDITKYIQLRCYVVYVEVSQEKVNETFEKWKALKGKY